MAVYDAAVRSKRKAQILRRLRWAVLCPFLDGGFIATHDPRLKIVGVISLVFLVLAFSLSARCISRAGRRCRPSGRRKAPPPAVADPLFRRTVDLLQDEDAGREHVEVLFNGNRLSRLWADLRSARQTITLQMYYGNPGRVATR